MGSLGFGAVELNAHVALTKCLDSLDTHNLGSSLQFCRPWSCFQRTQILSMVNPHLIDGWKRFDT